jgi:trimeric autotransporter adhesin
MANREILAGQYSSMYGLWHFNNDATDSSGNGNNLGLYGAPTYITSTFNKAVDYNGSSQGHIIPYDASFPLTSAITIALIIRRNSIGTAHTIIGKNHYSGSTYAFNLTFDAANKLVFYFTTDGTAASNTSYTSTDTYTDTSSYHDVVVTMSSGTVVLYVDGVVWAGTKSGSHTAMSNHNAGINIAMQNYPSAFEAGGDISIEDLALYNAALTASQVSTLFGAGGGGAMMMMV